MKTSIYAIILTIILAVAVTACTQTNKTPALGPPTNTEVKLSDSRYAPYAFLISGDTIDSAAQQAMTGFQLTKTQNADGSTTIKLTSTNPEYHDQTYTLKTGQQLYFIETNMGDDPGTQEANLGDDSALVVDANGYIVN